ncbi:myocilin opposite strand protein [Ornithorhynchus anatinus]|uniref:myocilin opposite strand protein n=1 Tax=Ornithorhynchus anatinus TaxID=9258 RepID=UPI0010A83A4A|nr:myocilin opposite strand protein [Ornithorhynchus anatinus]
MSEALELMAVAPEATVINGITLPPQDFALEVFRRRSIMSQRILNWNENGGDAGRTPCHLGDTPLRGKISPIFTVPPPPPPSPSEDSTGANPTVCVKDQQSEGKGN